MQLLPSVGGARTKRSGEQRRTQSVLLVSSKRVHSTHVFSFAPPTTGTQPRYFWHVHSSSDVSRSWRLVAQRVQESMDRPQRTFFTAVLLPTVLRSRTRRNAMSLFKCSISLLAQQQKSGNARQTCAKAEDAYHCRLSR
jgi:hypothetical protein